MLPGLQYPLLPWHLFAHSIQCTGKDWGLLPVLLTRDCVTSGSILYSLFYLMRLFFPVTSPPPLLLGWSWELAFAFYELKKWYLAFFFCSEWVTLFSLSFEQMMNNSYRKAYKTRDCRVIGIGCEGDDLSFILRAVSFALEASGQGCAGISHLTPQEALDHGQVAEWMVERAPCLPNAERIDPTLWPQHFTECNSHFSPCP